MLQSSYYSDSSVSFYRFDEYIARDLFAMINDVMREVFPEEDYLYPENFIADCQRAAEYGGEVNARYYFNDPYKLDMLKTFHSDWHLDSTPHVYPFIITYTRGRGMQFEYYRASKKSPESMVESINMQLRAVENPSLMAEDLTMQLRRGTIQVQGEYLNIDVSTNIQSLREFFKEAMQTLKVAAEIFNNMPAFVSSYSEVTEEAYKKYIAWNEMKNDWYAYNKAQAEKLATKIQILMEQKQCQMIGRLLL